MLPSSKETKNQKRKRLRKESNKKHYENKVGKTNVEQQESETSLDVTNKQVTKRKHPEDDDDSSHSQKRSPANQSGGNLFLKISYKYIFKNYSFLDTFHILKCIG